MNLPESQITDTLQVIKVEEEEDQVESEEISDIVPGLHEEIEQVPESHNNILQLNTEGRHGVSARWL